ncbi:MAG: tagaturonate epimerase family protein [Spirochaetota bacterium]|nr:tagaturonate epimerase family protein [Spirochaetota bacterium]
MDDIRRIVDELLLGVRPASRGQTRVYPSSIYSAGDTRILQIWRSGERLLLAAGRGPLFEELPGTKIDGFKLAPLEGTTRRVLNRHFPQTLPAAAGRSKSGIGLGDRLGLATPGHIRAVRDRDIFPVLAQQSMRELNLTGRTYSDVLNSACFGSMREGYMLGFGADGDHLKSGEDISAALEEGFSMITLDCSEHLDPEMESMGMSELKRRYAKLPQSVRRDYEMAYAGKEFLVEGAEISFDKMELARCILLYSGVIDFAERVYHERIASSGRDIDFELSIDETTAPTSPEAHYLVAAELARRGVRLTSLAPRFYGEFQKGVEYRGDTERFGREFAVHAAVADKFGYRLSVHSGSDKFSVLPAVGELTNGRFHLKTAGTSWLEAVRLIAGKYPSLYRRVYARALESFNEARRFYRVSAEVSSLRRPDSLSDEELAAGIDDESTRQVLHISYGFILHGEPGGRPDTLGREFLAAVEGEEELYSDMLGRHIGKHLELLGK